MNQNTIKRILSLLLVACMVTSLVGYFLCEDDPADPRAAEATENFNHSTTTEIESPTTEASATISTFAAEILTEYPVETFVDVVETVYAISSVNVRSGPGTDYEIVGALSYGQSIQRTGVRSNGWSRVELNGEDAYISSSYLSTTAPASDTSQYPLTYSDATCNITITKEWYENAWCYIAHLQFSDYTRFGTSCANGEYDNGYETTSHAANRLDAILQSMAAIPHPI